MATSVPAPIAIPTSARAGYVERVPDPADGRARVVRITDRALVEIAPVAIAEEQRIESEWREYLGDDAMRELRSILDRLREITDPYQK